MNISSPQPRVRARSRRDIVIPAAELRRLYCDLGLSAQALGKRLGCSEGAMRRRLIACGIVRRTPWKTVLCDVDEARRLYVDQGLSLIQVAARMGCSQATVTRRLNTLGVARREDGGVVRYPRLDFSDDPMEKAYLTGFGWATYTWPPVVTRSS